MLYIPDALRTTRHIWHNSFITTNKCSFSYLPCLRKHGTETSEVIKIVTNKTKKLFNTCENVCYRYIKAIIY